MITSQQISIISILLLFVVTLFFLCYSLISYCLLSHSSFCVILPWVRYGWYILLDFHWNFLHTGLLQVLQIYEWRHLLSIFITGYIHLLRTVWHNSRLIHTEAQYSGQHRTNVNHPRVYVIEMVWPEWRGRNDQEHYANYGKIWRRDTINDAGRHTGEHGSLQDDGRYMVNNLSGRDQIQYG